MQRLGVEFFVGAVADRDEEFVAGEDVPGELGCRVREVEPVAARDRDRARVHPSGGAGSCREGRNVADRAPVRLRQL